jgi:hypothetical protein
MTERSLALPRGLQEARRFKWVRQLRVRRKASPVWGKPEDLSHLCGPLRMAVSSVSVLPMRAMTALDPPKAAI